MLERLHIGAFGDDDEHRVAALSIRCSPIRRMMAGSCLLPSVPEYITTFRSATPCARDQGLSCFPGRISSIASPVADHRDSIGRQAEPGGRQEPRRPARLRPRRRSARGFWLRAGGSSGRPRRRATPSFFSEDRRQRHAVDVLLPQDERHPGTQASPLDRAGDVEGRVSDDDDLGPKAFDPADERLREELLLPPAPDIGVLAVLPIKPDRLRCRASSDPRPSGVSIPRGVIACPKYRCSTSCPRSASLRLS